MESIQCYHVIVKLFDKNKKESYTYVDLEYHLVSSISVDDVRNDALYGLSDLIDVQKEVIGIMFIAPQDFGKIDSLPANPYMTIQK